MEYENPVFEYNEDTGAVEYTSSGDQSGDSLFLGEESDQDVSSELPSETDSAGQLLPDQEEAPPDEAHQSINVIALDDTDNVMLLSDELATALLADSPAPGTLATSTLTHFDRIVSGLSEEYEYVAYRNDIDQSYSGTIVYGRNFRFDDDTGTIYFGNDAKALSIERYSSGNDSYVLYSGYDVSGDSLDISLSGTTLYYSNVTEGYPVLGGYDTQPAMSSYLVVGLISAMAVAVLNKLLNRR